MAKYFTINICIQACNRRVLGKKCSSSIPCLPGACQCLEQLQQGYASVLVYRADIILEKIPHAQDVFSLLNKQCLTSEIWQQIGVVIKQLHNRQVFHHDLNIHNLMLDKENKVWIIDFDKCQVKSGEPWKADNLQRLLRSLRKEKSKNPSFHWSGDDWDCCIQGYNNHV